MPASCFSTRAASLTIVSACCALSACTCVQRLGFSMSPAHNHSLAAFVLVRTLRSGSCTSWRVTPTLVCSLVTRLCVCPKSRPRRSLSTSRRCRRAAARAVGLPSCLAKDKVR